MTENQTPEAKHKRKTSDLIGIILAVIFLPLLIPLGVCALIYGQLLRLLFWAFYCTRGTNVLFVYSDSPVWKEYLENNIIPELPRTALKLNWSERKKWKQVSLLVLIFKHYGGSKEYNPLGIILRPFKKTKIYRFWKPFKDFKHGKAVGLEKLCGEFISEAKSEAAN